MSDTHRFTRKEELANSIIHGIGAALSVSALVLLIVTASLNGSAIHVVCFTIFGVTMVLLYVSSTLVHSFPEGRVKDLFDIFDHSSIYLFIAGTYTPYLLIVIKGSLGWTLFGIIWGMAAFGVVFKAYFVKKFLFLSTFIYIVMGWLIVFAWQPLASTLPYNGLVLLVIGGVLYTVGSIFYVWRGFTYHHAIWHLFVLAGSAAHFFSIFFYVIQV
jgi:hemolysin III